MLACDGWYNLPASPLERKRYLFFIWLEGVYAPFALWSVFVSSDDLKMLQRDRLAAFQQLQARLSSLSHLQGKQDVAEGAEPAVVGEQYLVFTLAEREYAVKAEHVQGVERLGDLTPVPNVVPWVRGVMNLRGAIVSVVDLRMFLGLEQVAYTPRTRLLSLQCNEMVICFVVDAVSEMLPVPAAAITAGNIRQATIPHWAVPFAAGCALLSNRMLILLDVARLLFSEKMQRYQAIS
ncbi:chemotaxis signal transduction protein [Thermosporothrix hazakensis]|uniref:Chemotaxis signal transduction protein n=1 Tax=Thermosporothrix hazakensis TaxID=644383 RepID=A0A326U7V6_THEHA|nr:chemotaxis signal transduction protein [Thermosporothrix hazakensis]